MRYLRRQIMVRIPRLSIHYSLFTFFSHLKYKCDLLRPGSKSKDSAHATTVLNRVLRPQSSLRYGSRLESGRGRFFLQATFAVSSTRPLIAVIEADATDRRTLCTLLSPLQADVRGYDSAESYLDSNRSAPDCLITDVELPGMSGLELLRLLRSRGVPEPVILLGAEEDIRAAVMAMREGAVDFIEKSNVDLAILRCVSNVIEHHDTRRLVRTAH